jgi:hypothetical protein
MTSSRTLAVLDERSPMHATHRAPRLAPLLALLLTSGASAQYGIERVLPTGLVRNEDPAASQVEYVDAAPLPAATRDAALAWARRALRWPLWHFQDASLGIDPVSPLDAWAVPHTLLYDEDQVGAQAFLEVLRHEGHGAAWEEVLRRRDAMVRALDDEEDALRDLLREEYSRMPTYGPLNKASRRWVDEALLEAFPELVVEPGHILAMKRAARNYNATNSARRALEESRHMEDREAGRRLAEESLRILRAGNDEGYGRDDDYEEAKRLLLEEGWIHIPVPPNG